MKISMSSADSTGLRLFSFFQKHFRENGFLFEFYNGVA